MHGCVGEQVLVQECVATSHAWFEYGQSVGVLQPQEPPATHAEPFDADLQSAQAPVAPHALAALPPRQTPSGEQQPASHVEGDLAKGTDAERLARLLIAVAQGMLFLARTGLTDGELDALGKEATTRLLGEGKRRDPAAFLRANRSAKKR